MILERKYFKDVPDAQYHFFEDVIKKHPFKAIEIDGIEYEYIITNPRKRVVVLIPGAMFTPYMWFYTLNTLEKNFTIIVPKIPLIGVGANESVSMLKNILDYEKIEKATIVGYSYGGGIAQYFAEVYPNYIETLVLSHTGILRTKNASIKTEKMIRILPYLPSSIIDIVKIIRTSNGKKSDWYNFRKALFNQMFEEITKKVFIENFKKNLEFDKEIEYLPIGKVSWKGKTIILGTESDKDTFQYMKILAQMYTGCTTYVFKEPGGHHMLFLYPEKYSKTLEKLIL
jgi:pimeloyl-ACP methyl ester carboxylesterase